VRTPHILSLILLSLEKALNKNGDTMNEREKKTEEEEVVEGEKRGSRIHRNASSISSAMDDALLR